MEEDKETILTRIWAPQLIRTQYNTEYKSQSKHFPILNTDNPKTLIDTFKLCLEVYFKFINTYLFRFNNV